MQCFDILEMDADVFSNILELYIRVIMKGMGSVLLSSNSGIYILMLGISSIICPI